MNAVEERVPTCENPAKFLEELRTLYQSLPQHSKDAVKEVLQEQ